MKDFGLLFGLIVDVRWIDMRLFKDISWNSVLWWLIGIMVFLVVFTVASILVRLVFSRVTESWDSWFLLSGVMNRMQTWADELAIWAFPGAVVHYVITLALWHDTESLLLAWIHLVSLVMFLLDCKVRQLLRVKS